ncbi:hypothetical protein BDV12DRAFT_179535 [Aspergillus spectabilis]
MNYLSRWLFGQRSYRVLILGDDSCGKTTFIDRLKFNEVSADPIPTREFHCETVTFPSTCEWHLWEMKTS